MKKFVALAFLAFFFIISFGSSSLFAETWGGGCYYLNYNGTGDNVFKNHHFPTAQIYTTFLNQDNEATMFDGSPFGYNYNAFFEDNFMRAPEFWWPSHHYCILRSLVPGCGLNKYAISHYEYSVKPGCENDLILSVSYPKVQKKFLKWIEKQENEDALLPQT
jgi:hypothetical protein